MDNKIAFFGFTEKSSSAIEGLFGEKHVFFCEIVAFSDKSFILYLCVLCFFDCFFGGGICSVEGVVESEELNDASDVDDGYEDPVDHSFV